MYFEDDWPDLTCVCGEHAALLVDDDGEPFVVPLAAPATEPQSLLLTA